MKAIIQIICLSLLLVCEATVLTGTMSISETIEDFTYTTTTASALVNFQLILTPFYSAGLLIGKTVPFNVSTIRENWIHFDYLSENGCDFEGMVTGRTQDAFIKSNGTGYTIYLKLINFEPANAFAYTIIITQGNSYIQTCPVGLIRQIQGEYCQFCDFGHIGAFCSIARHSVNPSSQTSISLPPYSFTYFVLQTHAEITLYLSMGSGLMVFIQAQAYEDQIAGITNYLSPSLGQGKYVYTSSQNATISLPETGQSYLVGVINYQGIYVGLSILFKEKEGVNVTLIIIGVAGGLFLLVLVGAAIAIIRRINRAQREVLPDGFVPQPPRPRPQSKKLNAQEINFYFPELPLQDFYKKLQYESSYEDLKEEKMSSTDGPECVICLCSIAGEQKVRAGYCKHIFHSVCLTQWFRKQQNCPYCRQNYGKSATLQRYKILVSKVGKKVQGPDIVKAIFAKNEQMTLNTIEITDISGQNFM